MRRAPQQHAPAVAIFQSAGDVRGIIGPMPRIELALRWGLAPLYIELAPLTLAWIGIALWLNRQERAQALAS